MPPDPAFRVRPMARGETALIRTWADSEGWNPGTADGGYYHDADPDGFFLGELGGEPVACVSCVAYGTTFGFLGQYIVRPEHRGKGFGLAVWNAGMAHLGDRTVGLDGVLAQVANYEKSGFRFAHHHVRYHAAGGGSPDPGVVPLSNVPFEDVLAYDSGVFPAPRPRFLRGWVTRPDVVAVGKLRNGNLVGYGVLRPSALGYKVGPLFADDPADADAVFRTLLSHAPGATVAIDAPEEAANPATAEVVRRHGLAEVFRCARMYTRVPPAVPLGKVYGVTSLELG